MHHSSIADIAAVAGVLVSTVLGGANIAQAIITRRLETKNKALEEDRRTDLTRVDGIIAERAELAKENKELRLDLRQEIERLKDDVKEARKDSAEARETAAEWERKYSVEVLTNATLRAENDQLRSEIQILRDDIVSLKARFDNLQPIKAAKGS